MKNITTSQLEFAPLKGKKITARFDEPRVSSVGGGYHPHSGESGPPQELCTIDTLTPGMACHEEDGASHPTNGAVKIEICHAASVDDTPPFPILDKFARFGLSALFRH
jgi:hypothetical protein